MPEKSGHACPYCPGGDPWACHRNSETFEHFADRVHRPGCPFCEIVAGNAPATIVRERKLRGHELRIDAVRHIGDWEVRLTSSAVEGALACQACSAATPQVRRHEIRADQLVSAFAYVDPALLLRNCTPDDHGMPLDYASLCGDQGLSQDVEVRQQLTDFAGCASAIVFPFESVAYHARSNRRRSVRCGAQRTLSPVVRSTQRAVCILCIQPGVVLGPIGRHRQQLRRDVRSQGHLDPPSAGFVGNFARHARESTTGPNVDCVIAGFGLARRVAATVSVDPASQLSCPQFVAARRISAGEQCSTVATNPGLPACSAVIFHAAQTTIKPKGLRSKLPRAEGDGLALPWWSGKSKRKDPHA